MDKLKRPRGTRDLLPAQTALRRSVLDSMAKTAARYGYGEVVTPAFEHTELFLRKSGQEVVDQIYSFKDKGGRDLALRPELTAATVRLFSENLRDAPLPQRLWYFENCFRYERPQAGRYREFWQFGAELIGPDNAMADAEMIALAYNTIKETGLVDFSFRIGFVGLLKSILRFHRINPYQNYLSSGDELIIAKDDEGAGKGPYGKADDHRRYRIGNLFSIIDKQDIGMFNAYVNKYFEYINSNIDDAELGHLVELIFSSFSDIEEFEVRLRQYLKDNTISGEWRRLYEVIVLVQAMGIRDATLVPGIARGLDYYTGIVFEADVEALGAEKQVLGGGRYELSELFDLRPTPMTGFAAGFDRLCLALEKEGKGGRDPSIDVYVVPITKDDAKGAFVLASKLRGEGIQAEADLMERNMKKALAHASARCARFLVFFGGEERERGVVQLKDSATREQTEVPVEELIVRLKGVLKDN